MFDVGDALLQLLKPPAYKLIELTKGLEGLYKKLSGGKETFLDTKGQEAEALTTEDKFSEYLDAPDFIEDQELIEPDILDDIDYMISDEKISDSILELACEVDLASIGEDFEPLDNSAVDIEFTAINSDNLEEE